MVETSTNNKVRRFAPEPLGTTKRSNHAREVSEGVATGRNGSMGDADGETSSTDTSRASSKRRFAPQPVQTSTRSNRNVHGEDDPKNLSTQSPRPPEKVTFADDAAKAPARRKFSPQLIETASRTRRATDEGPALRPEDKTNVSPLDASNSKQAGRPRNTPLPPANTPSHSMDSIGSGIRPAPPQRQGSIRAHYTTRANSRQHSFKVPDLEVIESSESDENRTPNKVYKDATRRRESADDRFSGYLLALAARAAEKQLREQEIAVFPSTDTHDRVDHYVDRDSSGDDGPKSPEVAMKYNGNGDSDDEAAALKAMRKHGEGAVKKEETIQEPQKQRKKTGGAAFNVEFDTEAQQDAWMTTETPKNMIGGHQKDPDLKQMRKAASPPMLGGDIDFPRCPSPEHARFDVTQGAEYLKNSMCKVNSNGSGGPDGGLWGKGGEAKSPGTPNSPGAKSPGLAKKRPPPSPLGSPGSSTSGKSGNGLWGGFCTEADRQSQTSPTGIITPQRTPVKEKENPFESASFGPSLNAITANGFPSRRPPSREGGKPPPSPPASFSSQAADLAATSAPLKLEQRIATEFPDEFVTQVYNYLSIGFPVMAWKFDEELSKISGVPVEELKLDDQLADHRGYLRLGEGEISKDEIGIEEHHCKRWLALRMYCREWGRQMGVCDDTKNQNKKWNPQRAWGVPGRKGSWGQ